MNSTDKFWIAQFGILGVVAIVIIFCITHYWEDHNTKIVHLIEKGVDPIKAMCAIQDDLHNHPVCIVRATKK